MGVYLSTPCTDKETEEGSGSEAVYAVSEMQGWRKNHEDAHLASCDLAQVDGRNVSLFGVFDGHGGKDVAKFCQQHLAEELLRIGEFQQGEFGSALRTVFHRMDEMLEDAAYEPELQQYRSVPNPSDVRSAAAGDGTGGGGRAGGGAGGGLAGALGGDDPDDPMIKLLRALIGGSGDAQRSDAEDGDGDDDGEDDENGTTSAAPRRPPAGAGPGGAVAPRQVEDSNGAPGRAINIGGLQIVPIQRAGDDSEEGKGVAEGKQESEGKAGDKKGDAAAGGDNNVTAHGEDWSDRPEEDDSNAVAVETATRMGGSASVGPGAGADNSDDDDNGGVTLGRPHICELPNHRVMSGCTSVVALMWNGKIFVANAGDSRAVLSKNGVAVGLSEDHKPQSATEKARIEAAGGFVNVAGRVNGNLNLSRSIGDLKYKGNPGVPRAEQVITAEPDITVTDVTPDAEFMILACDGVWDCMTNQDSVDFVRSRMQEGKSLDTIAEEVLDFCLADDPRQTTGIGGDNMTCLIVDLRKGTQGSSSSSSSSSSASGPAAPTTDGAAPQGSSSA